MGIQNFKKSFITGVSSFAILASLSSTASALIVRDDVGIPQSEIDAAGEEWDGVVQLINLTGGGGASFCTGSVINARTIITAAHCYNSNPSTAYGFAPGQIPAFAAFGNNTIGSLINFLQTGNTAIDERNFVSLISSVILHPDADLANGGALAFPGTDIALVALQDPLINTPSYSLLFSPVPVGTHVTQVAYGTDGTGLTGASGGILDGKRQIGENIIGLIGSQNDFLRGVFETPGTSIFGGLGTGGEQALYWIDFDDPDRVGNECARTDLFGFTRSILCNGATSINVALGDVLLAPDSTIDYFPGDALANEAGTAGGDSGSAIFVDELGSSPLIAGVLSGGFNFTAAVPNGYGDVSYYQPLFNFFSFISQFNPYKYVSAVDGDGNWSDTSHWVQDLDPGYFIIDADGNLINGLPTGPEPGVRGTGPKEGIIFDNDINDVQPTPPVGGVTAQGGTGSAGATSGIQDTNFRADVDLSSLLGDDASAVATGVEGAISKSTDDTSEEILKSPQVNTELNGEFDPPSLARGPGSTGFTPNNSQLFLADGTRNPNFIPEYFDVTLRNVGTTFADIDVEVDKLTLDNTGARLVINENINFTSLIDTQIATGTLDVIGNFTSRDILNGGLLTGTGTINAESLFNAGTLNAGTGGLDVVGDVILTSIGVLGYSGDALNVDGGVSIAGGLVLGFDGTPTFGDTGTLINYTGQQVGAFDSISDLPGVLFANVDYSQTGKVTFDVQAGSYVGLIGGGATANQLAVAGLLDQDRSFFNALSSIYTNTDLLSGDALNVALNTLSPTNALGEIASDLARTEAVSAQLGRRLGAIGSGSTRGVAVFNTNGNSATAGTLVAANGLGAFEASAASHASTVALKEGWGMFADITYYTGTAASTLLGAESDIDGFSFTGGVDYEFSRGLTLGAYVNYGTGDVAQTGVLSDGDFTGVAGGLYAHQDFGSGMSFSGYFGYGTRDGDLNRTVITGAAAQSITGDTDTTEFVGGAEVAFHLPVHDGKINITPSVRLDYADFNIDAYTETGGTAALSISDQKNSTAQLSFGALVDIQADIEPGNIRPVFGARYVHDLNDTQARLDAGFVNAPGNTATILGPVRDQDWVEVEGGIDFNINENMTGAVHVTQTIERSDLDYTSISAKIRYKF
jgi:outer membrane autotransporter protein